MQTTVTKKKFITIDTRSLNCVKKDIIGVFDSKELKEKLFQNHSTFSSKGNLLSLNLNFKICLHLRRLKRFRQRKRKWQQPTVTVLAIAPLAALYNNRTEVA